MKILLRPIPVMLAVLVCAGLSALSCGDKDRVTEPLTPEYLDVYVVTTINGKPFDSEVKVGRHLPAMLNIRLDEDTNTFSGYVQITEVGWLHINEVTSYPQQFSLTAPDSLGAIEYFGFCNLIYMPPVISGGYFAGGSSIDSFGLTFEATLTSVPAENVMNDEYYFAAGPGKTKVFVVESIGGYPLDKLPAEWGDVYPVILDVKHYEGTNAYFRGQIYFTTLGWLEIPNIFSYDGDFWIEYPDSLGTRCLYFLELQYNPPVLSGIFWPLSNSVPNPSKKYSFISRRMTMPNDDLPKEEFK